MQRKHKIILITGLVLGAVFIILAVALYLLNTEDSSVVPCVNQEVPKFQRAPMNLEDISAIGPLGFVVGAHVIPSDHMGFFPKTQETKVYALAKGTLISISVRKFAVDTGETQNAQYHLIIQHSCDIKTEYDIINILPEKLAKILPENDSSYNFTRTNIEIAENEELGKVVGTHGLDLWVVDNKVTLPGFVNPDKFPSESVHTVDPLDYIVEPLRSKLIEKSLRSVAPFGGKIDYDVDGYLIGDWLKEGATDFTAGDDPQNFWKRHLAFVYNTLDPTHVLVSMGDYEGKSAQFAIKGNLPDPSKVNLKSGLIKFELVEFSYIKPDGSSWDRMTPTIGVKAFNQDDYVKGVVLVQMIEDRKIKFETFPGKTAADVIGFDDKAVIYTR